MRSLSYYLSVIARHTLEKVSHSLLAEQNIQLLHTLRDIIDQLDNTEYTATKAPYYNSSIGAHTRHILDHYLDPTPADVLRLIYH